MTYTVIIAEDEQIERTALQLILHTHMPHLQIIAEARNGVELLELCKKEPPDFVLLDINMPGISGLDAMEQLTHMYPDISFIVLSAHADFSYAQRALQLGAADYLTKPIKTELLIKTLNQQIQKMSISTQHSSHFSQMSEKMQLVSYQIERNIMQAFVSNHLSETIRQQFSYFFDTPSQYLCILVRPDTISTQTFHSHELFQTLREQLLLFSNNLLLQDTGALHFIILSVDTNKIISNTHQYLYELRTFLNMIYKKSGVSSIYIYIGNPAFSIDDLFGSYRELSKKCMQYQIKNVPEQPSKFNRIIQIEQKLLDYISQGNTSSGLQLGEELFSILKEKSFHDINIFKEYLRDSFNIIQRDLFSKSSVTPSFLQALNENFIFILRNTTEFASVETGFLNFVMSSCEYFNLQDTASVSEINMSELTAYIQENYTQDISLDQLAEKYNISTSYLSKHIKNYLGKNYIDYITDLRIQKAKELLLERKKTIKEISSEVGYNSQTYFCKVFKRIVGINASEYVELGEKK